MNTASDTTDIIQAKPRVERVSRLVEWKPWPFPNPSLIGHCSIAFSGGWCVHRVPVFKRADGSLSVSTPEAADVDREGRIKLKSDGKRKAKRRPRPKSATVADLPTDLEQMAAKLREAGWAVREPAA